MKKKLFALFFILLFLNGCVKSTTTMKINSTKSINFDTTFLVSKEIENASILDKIAQDKLVANGYNISTVDEDNYSGVKVTKRFSNIDRVSSIKGEEVIISDLLKGNMDDKVLFKVKKSFFRNTYFATYKYRLRSEINANGGDDVELTSDKMISLDGEMFYKFVLEVPYGTIQNNANEVSKNGKVLTWTLNRGEDSDITFSFTLLNLTRVYSCIGAVGAAAILLLVVIIKVIKKKREELKNAGPIHVDYDPSIEDKLDAFEVEEEIPPEVAQESSNNTLSESTFEYKLEEEEKAKVAIVEAAKTITPEKRAPKFINTNSVEEIVDFGDNNSKQQ